jgi:hypothetical protein
LIADRLPEQEMLTMWSSQRHQESWFHRRTTHRVPAPPGRSFRPRLEGLEDRTVLSTLTVVNALDKGAGSLRDTITSAKSGDTIVFAPGLSGQTITLTSDELAIKKSLDIEGPGAGLLAISGNDTNRVFDIVNEGLTVTIAGLTITHARAGGATQDTGGGGGILNVGSTLTLANDILSYNIDVGGALDAQGGAVSNIHAGAVLTVTDSTFTGNRADGRAKSTAFGEGGAIYNGGDGSQVDVLRCTFSGNQAFAGDGQVVTSSSIEAGEANGGAIHNEAASSLTVRDSAFVGNQAVGGSGGIVQKGLGFYVLDGASGGAIADDDGTGPLVISGCTFSYNLAVGGSSGTGGAGGQGVVGIGDGGALGIIGPATVSGSTFDHNQAMGGSGNLGFGGATVLGRGVGGAIQSVTFEGIPASLTVSGCTFTANQAVGGNGNAGTAFVNEGLGGAIDNGRGATAAVTASAFIGNQAIGGQGARGQNGGIGLGGALSNFLGSTLTVTSCTLTGNSATGSAGGRGADGGNGFGGGIYNDGQSTLTVTGSTIKGNQATGGAAGSGGSAGQGAGGGVYFATGGFVCLDAATVADILGNTASTSNDDIFGVYTIC